MNDLTGNCASMREAGALYDRPGFRFAATTSGPS
jgi:hypothetical protein